MEQNEQDLRDRALALANHVGGRSDEVVTRAVAYLAFLQGDSTATETEVAPDPQIAPDPDPVATPAPAEPTAEQPAAADPATPEAPLPLQDDGYPDALHG